MRFHPTPLVGCYEIELEPIGDERGWFARTFCARTFAEHGLNPGLAQASSSYNKAAGTLRALHFQAAPKMEDKLVRCAAGAIFDVAVDLRIGSPTFGRWHGSELSAGNGRQLYVPQGFAHGFQTLEPNTVVLYHIAQFFDPELTAGIVWNDPTIDVRWPLEPVAQSTRDLALPRLDALDQAKLMAFEVDARDG